MRARLRMRGIRTRLLLAYVSIILAGFGGLAIIAGGQISSGAQVDYTQRLKNEIVLIAQGIGPIVYDYTEGEIDQPTFDADLQDYEAQVDGTLKLYPMQPVGPSSGVLSERDEPHFSFDSMVEMETAIRGQVILVERPNEAGEDSFYTAALVSYRQNSLGIIQLSVPAGNLQSVVTGRWLELVLLCALVGGAAVLAAFWLAGSIIGPLSKLRESATRLAEGDFSHRIHYMGNDEIGEVALAFNEMAQQVESMLEEQRAFASNTSHELRTPMTTVRLRTEALRYDSSLDPVTAKRYVEEIDDEIARLGNLVEDLTLLSRFDAGRGELGHDQVDMLRFATSMQQQMSQEAESRNILIALVLPKEPVLVDASLNHLTVVFRNLLDNAIKYTPQGGVIQWNIDEAGEGISSTICDPGAGIDASHLPRLFERFYRADKARSRDIPGTGLGLALVKSIVEAYGGSVLIDSSGVDKGTTVTVFWPLHPQRDEA